MTMYAVTATATWTHGARDNEWQATRQLPTFYLDSDTQGIVSEEHARKIASEVFAWIPASIAEVFVNVQEVWPDND